jgi:hypothetical protein
MLALQICGLFLIAFFLPVNVARTFSKQGVPTSNFLMLALGIILFIVKWLV